MPVEIEYRGENRWRVLGETWTQEHRNWEIYEEAVVLQGKDPTGGERRLFPVAYFIDPEARHPVTKTWLHDQVNAQLLIS
jgi:hypothetical protein